MEIRISNTLADDIWNRFAMEHPCANIYHTREMFQVFDEAKGYWPKLWVAQDEFEQPLCLFLPVQINLIGGPFTRYLSRMVVFGGVLCSTHPASLEALKMLLDAYNSHAGKSALFTEFRNFSFLQDFKSTFGGSGYVFNEHLNILKDLTRSPESLWGSLRSTARNNVRKARKNGVTIHEVHDEREIPRVYSLLNSTYRRIQVPIPDYSLFQSAFKLLHPKNMMSVFLARVDSSDIATLALLMFKDVIICWYTGSLREYSSYRASDLLFWHASEWGRVNGFRTLDFGGAGRPGHDYGVRKFKEKFGDEIVNHGRYIHIHAPNLFNFYNRCYQLAQNLNLTRANLFLPTPTK